MSQRTLVIVLLVTLLGASQQRSTPESPTYVAGVVEFDPVTTPRPENVLKNLASYEDFIRQASDQGVDIIVFPEIGLVGYGHRYESVFSLVPSPGEKVVPCDDVYNSTETLKRISCAAKNKEIYVVVNLPEQRPCEEEDDACPKTGRYQYNTNVVFDRQGMVVARYRKFNLFGEDGMNITPEPEEIFFDTDFGVRFGTFICFDIMFGSPAIDLVKKHNVRDIIFPTAWFSELPFLTALQAQQGWAYSMDVNFLGSGYSDTAIGSGGSGIYQGKSDELVHIMPEQSTHTLLTMTLKKKTSGSKISNVTPQTRSFDSNIYRRIVRDLDGTQNHNKPKGMDAISTRVEKPASKSIYLKKDHLDVYTSEVLEVDALGKRICSGEFCCNFTVEYETTKEVNYTYRAVVFDGVRSFDGVATGGVQICSVLFCTGDEISSCASRSADKNFGHKFAKIIITGDFLALNASQIPTTLTDGDDGLLPLTPSAFSFDKSEESGKVTVTMKLVSPGNNLMTFGIYGRDFSRDGQPATKSKAVAVTCASLLLLCSLLFQYFT